MWDKIFTGSLVIFAAGMLQLMFGGYLLSDWTPDIVPLGIGLAASGSICAAVGGIGVVVSGIAVMFDTKTGA